MQMEPRRTERGTVRRPAGDGLPSRPLVWGAMMLFAAGVPLGIYLLWRPPLLAHERERTSAAPPVVRSTPVAGQTPRAVPSQPVPDVATTEAGTATPAPSTPVAGQTTPVASPVPAVRQHTIRSGDTLLGIAAQYDTTVDAIRAANPGLTETALRIGAEIVIPPSR